MALRHVVKAATALATVCLAAVGCAAPDAPMPAFAGGGGISASAPLEPLAAQDDAAYAIPVEAPLLSSVVVTTAVASLPVYDAPDGNVTERLGPTAKYGTPLTMLAVGDIGGTAGWVQVQLPERWGHQYGWVRLADVTLDQTTTRVEIYLAERQLDVVEAGEVVLTLDVAVGASDTPTPAGLWYVTERIDLTSRPGGVYGPFILALSGYSDSFTTFGGGAPQLAIHGTNAPGSIGKAASNGCVRVANDRLGSLVELVGVGTPVVVHDSRG